MGNAQINHRLPSGVIALSIVLPLDPVDYAGRRPRTRKNGSAAPLFAKVKGFDLWSLLNTDIDIIPSKPCQPEESPTRLRLVTSQWVDKTRGKSLKR
jgi:hypothetical protein